MSPSYATIRLAIIPAGARLRVMGNGHHYPSEYAWHFGERTDHPATQHEVLDELRRGRGARAGVDLAQAATD